MSLQAAQDAILDAFTPDTLRQALKFELGSELDELVGPGDFRTQVFSVLREYERRGQLERLINALRRANPGNQMLQSLDLYVEAERGWRDGMTGTSAADVIREIERIRSEITTLRSSLFGDAAIRQAGIVDKLDEIERDLRSAQRSTERLLEQVRMLRWLVVAVMVSTLVILFSLWVMQWAANSIGLVSGTLPFLSQG